jgi:hypothetical protein
MAVRFPINSKIALKSDHNIRGVVVYHHTDFAKAGDFLYEVSWDIYKDHKTFYFEDMLIDIKDIAQVAAK